MSAPPLRISVFGLGYVGCVSAACLARDGHTVVGVDVNPDKVAQVAAGRSPISEPHLDALVAGAVASGALTATTDSAAACGTTEVSIVCVGTPSREDGGLELRYVERVCRELGGALARKSGRHTVLLRSTVLPGTTEEVAIPALSAGADRADLIVAFHPEFLREGSAIRDYDVPARVVVGGRDDHTSLLRRLYPRYAGPIVSTGFRVAEMIKYADNAFHALKVAFANEIGTLARLHGLDGRTVMEIFAQDTKLNVSAAYLQPGTPFGGSCLPKDLRALRQRARASGVEAAVLEATLRSNEAHKQRLVDAVKRAGHRRIAVLGLSFKHDTDDLRESPSVELVETLVGKGYDVAVFDPAVNASTLVGANLTYVQRELPHLQRLLRTTLDDTVAAADVIVIMTRHPSFEPVRRLVHPGQLVVDAAGFIPPGVRLSCAYEGICW
jgi:GDP-mannose 6-dehydrogenase